MQSSAQNTLKGELIRITTNDHLELQGLLYEPSKKTDRIIVHVHGWTGNFYENILNDYIARACVESGYAFLSFNTRGAGFIQEFLKKKNNSVQYVKIGGCLEKFEDSLLDIHAAITFLRGRGYGKFVLEGHSTGCQKVLHYAYKMNESGIEGLVFLEPADDPAIIQRMLAKRYEEALTYARRCLKNKKPQEPMPEWIGFGVQLAAEKFVSMASPNSIEGRLFSVGGDLDELSTIRCPVLVISGDRSEYQDAESMQKRIGEVIKNGTEHIIGNAGHWFYGHEEQVQAIISRWIKQNYFKD